MSAAHAAADAVKAAVGARAAPSLPTAAVNATSPSTTTASSPLLRLVLGLLALSAQSPLTHPQHDAVAPIRQGAPSSLSPPNTTAPISIATPTDLATPPPPPSLAAAATVAAAAAATPAPTPSQTPTAATTAATGAATAAATTAAAATTTTAAAAAAGAGGVSVASVVGDAVTGFWPVFHPWVTAYLAAYFLRGGSGMEGLLSSVRDILWAPITQDAFRCVGG